MQNIATTFSARAKTGANATDVAEIGRAFAEIDMPPESDPLEPPLALGEAVRVVDDAASERGCVDRARVWLEGLESSSSAVVCFGAAPDDPTQPTSSEQTHERERIAL